MNATQRAGFGILLCLGLAATAVGQTSAPREIQGAKLGTSAGSDAVFALGMTRDGGKTYVETAGVSESVTITGVIRPEPGHIGQRADIFVVDRVNLAFTMKTVDGIFLPWNTKVSGLSPFLEGVTLVQDMQVEMYNGKLGAVGDHRLFLGYLPQDGILRYTPVPLRLDIAEAASGEINHSIVQRTLNRLPKSVNIPASFFEGRLVGTVEKGENTIFYTGSGDLTGDEFPEVLFTGWTFRGWGAEGTPPEAPIVIISTSASGAELIEAEGLLGVSGTPGTTQPRILDLDQDGRNDFFHLGHNESPFVPTPSRIFLQEPDGSFSAAPLAGPRLESHNSNIGDFNGDGFPDIVASNYATDPDYYAAERASGVLPAHTPGWGYLMLYINDKAGGFTAYPFVTTNAEYGFIDNLGPGSASAIGDLDGDGNAEIVVVDALQDSNDWLRGESFILKDITLEDGVGKGELKSLPTPYFDIGDTYANYPSAWEHKTHSIFVDIIDLSGDGLPEIVVSAMLWGVDAGTQAGVYQILKNRGNLEFVDVTDSSLYNFFLGASASHQPRYVDVNGDGFPDLLSSDPYGQSGPDPDDMDNLGSRPQTWANRILINTGTGKFVQAMWNEFRENTLAMRDIAGDANLGRLDHIVGYYLLPDGRLGYIAFQDTYTLDNGFTGYMSYFDFRSRSPLSTGPNGSDPALLGAPGFSEYFYLTTYPEVAAAVTAGQYPSGLAHYLATGRSSGMEAFAANARIVGSSGADTVTLTGRRADYQVESVAGGWRLVDATGRHGTLTLAGIEKVQFTDVLLDLD